MENPKCLVRGRISKSESQWTIIRGVLSTESSEAGVSIVTSAVPVGYESSFESTQLTINEFYAGGFFMQMTLELWQTVKPPCRRR